MGRIEFLPPQTKTPRVRAAPGAFCTKDLQTGAKAVQPKAKHMVNAWDSVNLVGQMPAGQVTLHD